MEYVYIGLEILGLLMMAAGAGLLVLRWSKLRTKRLQGTLTEAEEKQRKTYRWLIPALLLVGFFLCMPNIFYLMSAGVE